MTSRIDKKLRNQCKSNIWDTRWILVPEMTGILNVRHVANYSINM